MACSLWLYAVGTAFIIQATLISGRIYNVNYNEVKQLVQQLTTDDARHVLLGSSHSVMRPAVQNYTDTVERIVVHYLLYHDSIRYSSRDCATQINSDSMEKLKSSVDSGYDCLKELVTFLRRSAVQSESDLSSNARHTIHQNFNECVKNFEETAEKQLENAWPSIKLCSYQEIAVNAVELDPTGISAKIREKQNDNQ